MSLILIWGVKLYDLAQGHNSTIKAFEPRTYMCLQARNKDLIFTKVAWFTFLVDLYLSSLFLPC